MAEQLPLAFEFRACQTFADFFPGGNTEAVRHLQNCAEGDGEAFMFLWGAPGLGKSHLLRACCQHAHQLGRTAFYFEFIPAALPNPGLLAGLHQFDLVCLDGIMSIIGHSDWEWALFNFFNQHRAYGRQLVVSAQCPPEQLPVRLPDLKTRLNWGLTLKLKPLPDDDKARALALKAKQLGFQLPPQVGRFLLTRCNRDLASLWAILAQLDQASLAARRKLTIPFLKQVLDQHHRG